MVDLLCNHDWFPYPNWPVEFCKVCRSVRGDPSAWKGFLQEIRDRRGLEFSLSFTYIGKSSRKKCKYGDPFCPCQDGDTCHYEGPNPMKVPSAYAYNTHKWNWSCFCDVCGCENMGDPAEFPALEYSVCGQESD